MAGSAKPTGEGGQGILRCIPQKEKAPNSDVIIKPKMALGKTRAEEEFMRQALALGYGVTPVTKLYLELAQGIASRLINRKGEEVYQSVAFSILNFPLSVLMTIFPEDLLILDSPGTKTWRLSKVEHVATILGPLLQEHSSLMCVGASRALKTASERWSRVLATAYECEISFVRRTGRVDHLYVNMLYVLTDEDGEMHLPKTPDRREIQLSSMTIQAIREQVLSDALTMEMQYEYPLSAGWLRSMGLMEKAAWIASLQKNSVLSASSSAGSSAGKKRRKRAHAEQFFDVEKILEEKTMGKSSMYLVRWAGYEPEWEVHRLDGHGHPGDPVETWEPWSTMKHTQAMQEWEEANEQP